MYYCSKFSGTIEVLCLCLLLLFDHFSASSVFLDISFQFFALSKNLEAANDNGHSVENLGKIFKFFSWILRHFSDSTDFFHNMFLMSLGITICLFHMQLLQFMIMEARN